MKRYLMVSNRGHGALADRFRSEGVETVTVEAPSLSEQGSVEALIGSVRGLIFADAASIEPFAAMLAKEGLDSDALLDLTICGFGSETVAALRRHSVHTDVIPVGFDAAAVMGALASYGLQTGTALAVVGGSDRFREQLIRESTSLGFALQLWPSGDVAWRSPKRDARLAALVLGGGIDAVVVEEPSDILAIEVAVATLTELGKACVFMTDNEECRIALAERGIAARGVSN